MSQWSVQLVIGKLIMDEDFRRCLEERGDVCLARLRERGIDLNETEIAALVGVNPRVWSRMASQIDRRLRKVGATSQREEERRHHTSFTGRQQRVLRGVFEGLTNKEIGIQVGVSESAVKATLQQLFRKSHVRTRAQLVRIAIEGWLGTIPRA